MNRAPVVHRVRVPFRAPFDTAAGRWTARESWIVVLRDDDGRGGHVDGRIGVGESVLEDAAHVAGRDAARLDLDGRWDPAVSVGVNATIGADKIEAVVQAAERAVQLGYRTLKLKAGASEPATSLAERVRAVRAAVGPAVALRLDANGSWDLPGAIERLTALRHAGLQYVEQPLPAAAVEAMATLRRTAGVPVAADEAVTSLGAARAILEAGAADVLVVKPARVGGPGPTAEIAALAAAHGVPVVISSLFETGIGLAAGIACAAALPDVPGWPAAERDHGLATADVLEDDLIVEPLVVERGRIRAPGGPGSGGLGVVLDEAALERYAVDR